MEKAQNTPETTRWHQPGQPYAVEIEGQQVWLKATTIGERTKLAQEIAGIDLKASPLGMEEFCSVVASHVERVSGFAGDVRTLLEIQPMDVLMRIYEAVLTGGSLSPASPTERKSRSTPAGELETSGVKNGT